jgi:hypothetical protein
VSGFATVKPARALAEVERVIPVCPESGVSRDKFAGHALTSGYIPVVYYGIVPA